jgi:glycosyltransferase involved in cell wall biosynthesis
MAMGDAAPRAAKQAGRRRGGSRGHRVLVMTPFSPDPCAAPSFGRLDAAERAPASPAAGVARGARRRWTINGDFTTLAPTGVARYAREVTAALDALVAEGHPLARDIDIDLVAPEAAGLSLEAIPLRIVPERRRPRLPQFWVQAQLPRHVPGGLVSFCNLAPVAVRRHIVCIHDLNTRLAPESYSPLFRLAHRLILPALGRRAAAVTTVSAFSRDMLVAHGVAPRGKIVVTHNGADHVARWDASRAAPPPPGRPYALCLGRAERHKNLDLLLRLAPLLDALGLDLRMAGSLDPEAVRARAGGLPPGLRLLGRIGDDALRRELDGALCFLFPSLTEGFGLPAVEAMACGCPVVAAPAGSLPEVCGDAALYADPDDPAAWAAAVARIQAEPDLGARLQEAGRARAARFAWRSIAETYLRLMRAVDAEGPTELGG